MPNYLVIPDIHHRICATEALISRHPNSIKVFLGDYFDDFGDGPTDAKRTAEWLRWSLRQDDRIHLMGNHDLPYFSPSIFTMCPGWSKPKWKAVCDAMTPQDWARVELVKRVDRPSRPLLLSHAGYTLANIYGANDPADVKWGGRLGHLRVFAPTYHLQEIERQCVKCRQQLLVGGNHHWLNRGSRMGEADAPGPFWMDFSEFSGVDGIDQIVGHTVLAEPRLFDTPKSLNWCIDTHGSSWSLISEEGNITTITK